MTLESPVTYSMPLSSREFHFLKPEPDAQETLFKKPDAYASDHMREGTAWVQAFASKLNKSEIPDNRFHCCALRLIPPESTPLPTTESKTMEALFVDLIGIGCGIWGRISKDVFAVALWNLTSDNAEARLKTLQMRISSKLNLAVTMGASFFPFRDEDRSEVFFNAVKALDHAAFFGPGSFAFFDDVSLNVSGDRLYETGDIQAASSEYKRGLAINPDNLNLLNSLGVCYGLMGEFALAREEFVKAISIDPDEVMAVYNAGLTCMIIGDHQGGLDYLQMASKISNNIFEVELTVGDLLCRLGKCDEARAHLDQARSLKPSSSGPSRILGDFFLSKNLPEKAIPEYNAAIRLNPADAGALAGLARAFLSQDKNIDIALTFAKESLSIMPDSPEYNTVLGEIYQRMGQKDKAEALFERAAALKAAGTSEESLTNPFTESRGNS